MAFEEDDVFQSMLNETPGHEEGLFNHFSARLLAFANSRLPARLSARLDADDIVQSVFRSFFRRNQNGEFVFDETLDIWRLLAAMTYNKVMKSIEHHGRHRRDVKRESTVSGNQDPHQNIASIEPTPEQVNLMFDYLAWLRSQLPESSQVILQLRIEGFSISEIADQATVSQRTVKRVLARIRELLATHQKSIESTPFPDQRP